MANVDIFVGNDTHIDPDVYSLWISGYSAHEAAQLQQKHGVLQQYDATFDMLLADTLDHFRTFSLLERYLRNPSKLSEQLEFQIAPDVQKMLIEKYYEFDSVVVRELLGKKLTSRYRNNLDDISDKTRIPLRSCRRQFDNVKRVFKTVEEMMGSLVENIRTNFRLSDQLARQYAAIVFITNNRFETTKKKLAYLSFPDFVHCANLMITNWSYSSKDCNHEDQDQDLDREFLTGLREIKILADKDYLDNHKILFNKALSQHKLSPAAAMDVENNFKTLAKSIISIGYNLNHSKELRDLFVDIVEKIIEPCKQAGWTAKDVKTFTQVYKDSSLYLDHFQRAMNAATLKVWERYTISIFSCINQMYHS